MAHGKRSKRETEYNSYTKRRENSNFASKRLHFGRFISARVPLYQISDKRRFAPYETAPKTYGGISARFKVAGIPLIKVRRAEGARYNAITKGYDPLPWRIGFVEPERVLVCVRRKIRREVLHAIAKESGYGSVSKIKNLNKKYIFNEDSKVVC